MRPAVWALLMFAGCRAQIVTPDLALGDLAGASDADGEDLASGDLAGADLACRGALVPEVCGNGCDDDGNGFVDDGDPACATQIRGRFVTSPSASSSSNPAPSADTLPRLPPGITTQSGTRQPSCCTSSIATVFWPSSRSEFIEFAR